MFACVWVGTYLICWLSDKWESIMNAPSKFAVIAWIVFAAVSAGGLGFALWGGFWGTMCAIAGGVLAHLALVAEPAGDSHLHL